MMNASYPDLHDYCMQSAAKIEQRISTLHNTTKQFAEAVSWNNEKFYQIFFKFLNLKKINITCVLDSVAICGDSFQNVWKLWRQRNIWAIGHCLPRGECAFCHWVSLMKSYDVHIIIMITGTFRLWKSVNTWKARARVRLLPSDSVRTRWRRESWSAFVARARYVVEARNVSRCSETEFHWKTGRMDEIEPIPYWGRSNARNRSLRKHFPR